MRCHHLAPFSPAHEEAWLALEQARAIGTLE
jgi:hypothetical protein